MRELSTGKPQTAPQLLVLLLGHQFCKLALPVAKEIAQEFKKGYASKTSRRSPHVCR